MNEIDTLTKQADALQMLEFKVMEAEEKLATLKAQYMQASRAAAETFVMNGLTEITTSQGVRYKVETVSQCNITKAAKPKVAEWLKKQGAEHLVKEQCIVPISQQSTLDSAGVIYEKEVDCNTNAVKAFVLGALGQKGSPATITMDDLPKGLNLFQYETVSRIQQ